MRAIIYARYSTDRQADSSIADQLRVCRQYAEQRSWQVVAEHRDEGISGAAFGNRPGVQAALGQLQRGDVLLVMDLSRLSRSQELAPLISQQHFRGVRVIGVQDGFDSTSRTARMHAGMSGIMSEEYRAQIADRTRSALSMRAEHGDSTGGRAYGYREGELHIVREIFQRFAEGESLKQIANDLNRRNVPSPGASWKREKRAKHGRWLASALRAIVLNERYVGRLIYNRSTWIREPGKWRRQRIERPESEWIIRDIEPLVDQETWAACQSRFKASNGAPGGVRKYLLSGILTCKACGSKMIVMGGKRRRYVCGTNHAGGEHACSNGASILRENVEAHVLDTVMTQLLEPEVIAHVMRQYRAAAKDDRQVKDDPQVLELERLVREGLLSREVAAAAIAEARRRSAPPPAMVMPSERMWRQAVAGLRDILESDEIPAARELLTEILGEVPLTPDGDHMIAEIKGRQVMIGTGTGIWFGSGGVIFRRIPRGRRL